MLIIPLFHEDDLKGKEILNFNYEPKVLCVVSQLSDC